MFHGIDIVYIPRIKKIIDKKKVLQKLFTKEELSYFEKHANALETIAGIYAAKEGLIKALHLLLSEVDFQDIEVSHDEKGAPYFTLYNHIKNLLITNNITLSISHDGDYAIASVIVY